jgi:hypothetical protein
MRCFLLVDAEASNVTIMSAFTPALAAEAIDISYGDKIGWRYIERPSGDECAGPGYEVFEARPTETEWTAARARAELKRVAFVDKSISLLANPKTIYRSAQPSRRCERLITTMSAAAAVILALMAHDLVAGDGADAAAKPPTELLSSVMLTPTVAAGGKLIMEVGVRQNETCTSHAEETYTRKADGVDVYHHRTPNRLLASSHRVRLRRITSTVPASLDPGEYSYRRVAFQECGGKAIPLVVSDDLPFTVVR